ncbi:MAG TPA: universal stress protein [Planctomycetota bacterium]|jgi:nucleotide-binding universal stress UspA family protein|nr:universal stress protein [Planctomycetota bacterium]
MKTYPRVVCGSDFSAASDDALRQALVFAAEGSRVTFVHGIAFPFVSGLGAPAPMMAAVLDKDVLERHATSEYRAQLARVKEGAERPAEIEIVFDDPGAAIVRCAEERQADLIVVGSRGSTGLRRMALGSVAESVVRHAPVPVLVARPSPTTGVVLVASDFSEASRAAIVAAAAEAKRRGAKLTILHCMGFAPEMMAMGFAPLVPAAPDDPRSRVALTRNAEQEMRSLLAGLGVAGQVVVDPGSPRGVVPEVAEQLKAELVVVGARGRGSLARLLLGSVARSVVRHAHCSVLVVR